ncbi:hypothetical protein HYFRA_00011138 [Hymenoscyphus fraxineus]|uniref:Uncharacterized protein n=1 Tax=Hymenoscyphus fraxineus TaxID=746836 RepID=A0A9N9PK74_9HELO|nr:hypothetical protein HYFRA_00011138 [Hymenoscyphus fraxineus]
MEGISRREHGSELKRCRFSSIVLQRAAENTVTTYSSSWYDLVELEISSRFAREPKMHAGATEPCL